MKKIISLIIALLICAALCGIYASADEPIYVEHSLDSNEALLGGLIKADTGTVTMQGSHSLKIQTQKASYGLNGDPNGDPDKYHPEYNGSRRTKLASFANGLTLPAGTYTVSIYVYDTKSNGDPAESLLHLANHKSEIALSLHGESETDESLAYNHADCDLIKLFKANPEDTSTEFAKSGVEQTVGGRKWAQYTAEITTTEELSQFTFWLIVDGDVGEEETIATWIDHLSIYNEAGTPEAPTEETEDSGIEGDNPSSSGGSTNQPNKNQTEAATDTEDSDNDAELAEDSGCGAAIGAGYALLAVTAVGSASALLFKKKRD